MRAENGSSANARQRARDLLVQALYQWQIGGHDRDELLSQFRASPEFARADKRYFRELLGSVIDNAERLDSVIGAAAGRDLRTVDAIGRAVLMLGLEELSSRADVPPKVVINEAIELAKRYGPPDCHRFVNAVLDNVANETGRKIIGD
ncbi:MAG TPA: transcription antitermination factor NusB [Gammaproteobacteria bacterium]